MSLDKNNFEKTPEPQHFMYPRTDDLSKADGVAWVLTNKDSKLEQYPFKFPELCDTDVRAKILHTGLCASDYFHAREKWGKTPTYPVCAGHEVVGQVTNVGQKVKDFKVGDIIGACFQRDCCGACAQCKRGNTQLCTKKLVFMFDPYFGGFSTHIQLPDRMTFSIPEGLPLDTIPPLLCAGLTVFSPIMRWAKQNPDKSLKTAVISIGGLGHLALQYLKKLGYHVTALTTSPNRQKQFKELGADDVQLSHDIGELEKQRGCYDFILSTNIANENDILRKHFALTAPAGTFVVVGLPDTKQISTLDLPSLVFNQISLQGSLIGGKQEMIEMLKFSHDNKIYPVIEKYPFEKFDEAFEKLEHGRPKFRIVVNVTDWAKKNGFDK